MGSGEAAHPMKCGTGKHLVLWDGDCMFCRRSVEWIERRNCDELVFMPYQQASSSLLNEELRRACAEAVHVITLDGRILHAADAWLFMLRAIGWRAVPALLGTRPLYWFTELGYRIVARHRHWLSRLLIR